MNNYFTHDSNARNADNILALRMRLGAEGYGIYFMILERLREEPDYTSVKDYNMLAFDFRVGSDKVKSVVEDFGLFHFTEDGERFYSDSFLRRMQVKDEKSEKAKASASKRWEKMRTQCDGNANALQTQCDGNAIKGKKSKENSTSDEVEKKKPAASAATTEERKEQFRKSLVPFVDQYGREMIREFFDYWSELTPSRAKMRYELERTWETPRRLATWSRRDEEKSCAKREGNDNYGLRKDAETIGRTERRSTTL